MLFPEKLRIRENSRISGAGNSSDLAVLGLEKVPAEGAGGVVGGGEPLVEAGRVELLLAGPAAQLGQLVVGAVQDLEADVALLEVGEFRVLG